MRNLTITLTSEDGKLQVSESTGWHDGWGISPEWTQLMLDDLRKHLDALEARAPVPPARDTTSGKYNFLDIALKK